MADGSLDLTDRVVLVTGASRGLGAASARAAAAAGAHVVALARTQGGLEELDDAIRAQGGAATLVPADIRDGDGLDRLGAALHARWGRLDGVIANAAEMGPLTPVPDVTAKDWEATIATNLTANARLVRALDPLLRVAPAGRAAFVTCAQARAPEAYWGAYAASKAGLEMLVRAYAEETRRLSVRVNLFDPGPMNTALRRGAFPGEAPSQAPAPDGAASALLELLAPTCARHGERVRYEASA